MVLFDDTVPPPTPLIDGADPATTGTPTDEAWYVDLSAALDAQLHSAADPTKMPSDTIAEMADARGAFDTLNERLEGVVDSTGNPVGLVLPSMVRNGFAYGNALANDTFLMWSRGDAAAPDFWQFSGNGGSIARTGVGLADTRVITGQDHFAVKLTSAGDQETLTQLPFAASGMSVAARTDGGFLPVVSTGDTYPGYDVRDSSGLRVYAIGFVWSDAANRARVFVQSGLGNGYSEYHPGDSDWHPLIATATFGSGASFGVGCAVETTGAAYFQCVGMMFVPLGLPPMWIPSMTRIGTHDIRVIGNPAAGNIDFWSPARPVHVVGCQMLAGTAPTGTVPTVDLQVPVAGVWTTMFSTLPTMAASKRTGTLQVPDGTYARRTVRGCYTAGDAALPNNSAMRAVYVDDGSNTLEDLIVRVHYIEYIRPFEQFRSMTELSE